ncbi:MAG: saccharopine dehydrogenase NADP-binding domain-containing protein [Desulfobacterales bacterium]|jgi:saccharopine dehydrogenase-like NADP-dependent oxidoreductase
MKKIIIIGVGAQGSTIARRMDEHPGVSNIICADYDIQAAEKLSSGLKKATALGLDARNLDNIIRAAEGCDLMVNGLPLQYNLVIMEAALSVNASYIDMAGPMEDIGFVESYKLIFSQWHERFKEKDLTALIGCGSSPGLANIVARESVDEMDSCDHIGIYIYEGVWAKRYTPFWWSPEVAFGDMAYNTFRFEDGKIIEDAPFSRPVMMQFSGIDKEIRMVDHEHDEPVTMGLLADKVLKSVKNVEFKYGGPHVELSEALYQLGLLSKEPVNVNGTDIVPMDLVIKLCPPAPKFPDEIKNILDEGLVMEEGAFLVRVDGHKGGKPIRIDCNISAPGLVEAFEKSNLSHEAYLTGQCAAVFVGMMVDDAFVGEGLFVPEQLPADSRRYCFQKLAKLGITVEKIIE